MAIERQSVGGDEDQHQELPEHGEREPAQEGGATPLRVRLAKSGSQQALVDAELDQEADHEGEGPRGDQVQSELELERRQRVQTLARTDLPLMSTIAACRLGRKRRFVRTLEWLTLCPYCGPLPQISHFLAMVYVADRRQAAREAELYQLARIQRLRI